MTTKNTDILKKIQETNLVGRGGAGFPVYMKWKRMKEVESDKKYVVCNASEGEPDVKKDHFILSHHPELVVKGIVTALDYLDQKEAYFNINEHYYKELGEKLKRAIKPYESKGYIFHFYIENPSYIGGETGAILNAIEGKRTQPRAKKPSPSILGIFGKPTLLHNVETLYNVGCVAENRYKNTRFYTVGGKVKNPGVYELPDNYTVEKVLRETNNYPLFSFFAQVGGGASGVVINKEQMKTDTAFGCASIQVYDDKTNTRDLLLQWFAFYDKESCGKCTPCREGTYQLYEMTKKSKKIPWKNILEIIDVLKTTTFCALGSSLPIPVESYIKNVLKVERKALLN